MAKNKLAEIILIYKYILKGGMTRLDLLLKLSIIILVGVLGGRIANYFKLPSVSGYIVAGLIIGPSIINLVSSQDVTSLAVITEVALAAIAFSIGNEFLLSDMKKVGKDALIITVFEVVGALDRKSVV